MSSIPKQFLPLYFLYSKWLMQQLVVFLLKVRTSSEKKKMVGFTLTFIVFLYHTGE